jgi:hypothetical protein
MPKRDDGDVKTYISNEELFKKMNVTPRRIVARRKH